MFSQYLEYRALMMSLNHFPRWYKVNGHTNGLDMTKGVYYPGLDVLSQSIEQAGNPHPIMDFETWKNDTN